MSILIAILCVSIAAAAIYVYTRNWQHAALGAAFLFASPGLLLQSLVIRSELTSVLFLCLAVLFIATFQKNPQRMGFPFLAGVAFALAYATKIQVLPSIALLVFFIAVAMRKEFHANGESFQWIPLSISCATLGFVFILGFAMIRTFHPLNLAFAVHRFVNAFGIVPSAITTVGILAISFLPVGTFLYLRHRVRSTDFILGLVFILVSLAMGFSPVALALVARFRGKPFDDSLYCLWQVIAVSVSLFGVGLALCWKKKFVNLPAKEITVGWIFVSGFFAGILLSLSLISGFADSGTAALATELRLFSFKSMNEFTVASPAVSATAKTLVPLNEFKAFLSVYVLQNYLLIFYSALLVLTLSVWKSGRRYVWPSLCLFGMGFVFMTASSFRYYAQQYWIYIDFFWVCACALLVFGLAEQFAAIRLQWGVLTFLALLYATQYGVVVQDYPKYNFDLRDRIDEAGHAIYRVPDYADLIKRKYGDNLSFMRKILSDPVANGSERGIDLLSRPGVQNAIRNFPEIRSGVHSLPISN
jgi:hypothetical protein